jgi:CubicO group peptidase (beta-lactamase class C family)
MPAAPAPARAPRHLALALLPLTLLARPAAAQRLGEGLEAVADRVFAAWNRADAPGCQLGVARGGETLLLQGYGMADLEGGRAIDGSTIFESGSVAKQFTASAIVLLALEGKLSLDDDVRRWIPELPAYDAPITIRHLLNHTSGLREWSNLVAVQGWPRGRRAHRQAELLAVVTAQRALNYPVGTTYSYTNSGFALLPTIVERMTGQSFTAFSQARLFGPLGLTDTRWRDDLTTIVPRRAPAYAPRGRGWRLEMPFEDVHGPGGLLTTARDWLRWNAALDAKTLGVAWADTLIHRSRVNSGREIRYALGLTVDRFRGTPEWSHSGSTGGYSTFLARYPALGRLSVAVLCNAASANPTALTRALVAALHPELPAPVAPDTVPLDAATVAPLAGWWRSLGPRTAVRLVQEGGRPTFGGAPLRGRRGGGWLVGEAQLLVAPGEPADRPQRLLRIGVEADTTAFERMPDAMAGDAALTAIAGRYRNDEVDMTYVVRVAEGRLRLSVRPGLEITLEPTYRDGFTAATLGDLFVTRDARGRVRTLHVASQRLWDLVFTRLPGGPGTP